MDLISQLQDHTNHIACLLFDTIGTLQRDASPAQVPGKPLPAKTPEQPQQQQQQTAQTPGQPVSGSPTAQPPPEAAGNGAAQKQTPPGEQGPAAAAAAAPDPAAVADDVRARASALVKSLKLFEDMACALPEEVDVGEKEILERIRRVQEENEEVGRQLAEELEAVEKDKEEVERLFTHVARNSLNNRFTGTRP